MTLLTTNLTLTGVPEGHWFNFHWIFNYLFGPDLRQTESNILLEGVTLFFLDTLKVLFSCR